MPLAAGESHSPQTPLSVINIILVLVGARLGYASLFKIVRSF